MEEEKKNNSKKITIRGFKTKEYSIAFKLHPNLDSSVSKIQTRRGRWGLIREIEDYLRAQNPDISEEEFNKKSEDIKKRIHEIGNTVSDLSEKRKKVGAKKEDLRDEKKALKDKLKEELSDEEKEEINKKIEDLDKEIKAKTKEQTKLTRDIKKQYESLGALISEVFNTKATLNVGVEKIEIEPKKGDTAIKGERGDDTPPTTPGAATKGKGGDNPPIISDGEPLEPPPAEGTEDKGKGKGKGKGKETEVPPVPVFRKPTTGDRTEPAEPTGGSGSRVLVLEYTRKRGDKLPISLLSEKVGKMISDDDYFRDFDEESLTLPENQGTHYKVYAKSKEIWDKYLRDAGKGSVTPTPVTGEPDRSSPSAPKAGGSPKPEAAPAKAGKTEPEGEPGDGAGSGSGGKKGSKPEKADDGFEAALDRALKENGVGSSDSKALTTADKLKALLTEGKMSNKLLLLFGASSLIGLVSGMSWLGFAGIGGLLVTVAAKVIGKYRENHPSVDTPPDAGTPEEGDEGRVGRDDPAREREKGEDDAPVAETGDHTLDALRVDTREMHPPEVGDDPDNKLGRTLLPGETRPEKGGK